MQNLSSEGRQLQFTKKATKRNNGTRIQATKQERKLQKGVAKKNEATEEGKDTE
jgi:hypothetical protein